MFNDFTHNGVGVDVLHTGAFTQPNRIRAIADSIEKIDTVKLGKDDGMDIEHSSSTDRVYPENIVDHNNI